MIRTFLLGLVIAASPVLAASETPACRPIGRLDEVLKPGKILLLGEIHGTAESPAFVADLACHAARASRPVTVVLEINRAEIPRVEAYLASKSLPEDRAALVQGSFWNHQPRDGRNSEAMVTLLDSLRKLRQQGASLKVELIDPGPGNFKDGQDRDRQMAANLAAAVERSPGDVFVALTGNLHNRIVRGWSQSPDYEWMGYVLRQKYADRLISLNASSSGGTTWSCFGEDCGPKPMKGREETGDLRITLHPRDDSGWDGTYFIGAMTARRQPSPQKRPGSHKPRQDTRRQRSIATLQRSGASGAGSLYLGNEALPEGSGPLQRGNDPAPVALARCTWAMNRCQRTVGRCSVAMLQRRWRWLVAPGQ